MAAGLTQSDLARLVGDLQVMSVSNWERGVSRPNDINLVALAGVLGRTVAWFYSIHDLGLIELASTSPDTWEPAA